MKAVVAKKGDKIVAVAVVDPKLNVSVGAQDIEGVSVTEEELEDLEFAEGGALVPHLERLGVEL
jgi:hypothetical protein